MSASISASYYQNYQAYQTASQKQSVASSGFSLTASVETTGAESAPKQTLEEFKKEFAKFVDSLPIHPSQANASQSISIHDNVFEKMMNDPEYKTEIENMVRDGFAANFSPADPAFCTMRLDANGEYSGSAGGSFHMDKFGVESADAFWKKDSKASNRNNNDDSFWNRKSKDKAAKKKTEQQKFMEQLGDNRRRQQDYLQGYFANKSLFGSGYQTASVTASSQTATSSIFESMM